METIIRAFATESVALLKGRYTAKLCSLAFLDGRQCCTGILNTRAYLKDVLTRRPVRLLLIRPKL